MQLLGVARSRRRLRPDLRDRVGVEMRQVVLLERDAAPELHGSRASLLEGCVVEESEGLAVQDLMREQRRLDCLDEMSADLTGAEALEQLSQALEVECLGHAVMHGLAHDRVVRDLNRPSRVLLAGGQSGEDSRHEVVGLHPLDGGRDSLAPARAQGDERSGEVPSPARGEERRWQDGLLEGVLDRLGSEEPRHVREREAVLRPEREDDGVVVRRRLQLEVEAAAEALA